MEIEKTEIAKAVLTKGLSTDLIQEVTKLPKQAVEQLMKNDKVATKRLKI
jgi:hypothetical protein